MSSQKQSLAKPPRSQRKLPRLPDNARRPARKIRSPGEPERSPFAVSCSLRAETRSAKGERHATFYEQISGPDSWNTEWLRPLGVSGFAAAVELRLLGPGFAVPGGAGDGTIPLAEPYPVQGLLGPREARQPEGEAGQRPTV